MKTQLSVVAALLLPMVAASGDSKNLLPNGNFEGREPLNGWITSFPDEGFYKANGAYVKLAPSADVGKRRAIVIDLPPGIAGNQGGKIESVPVPVEPGAKYKIEVDSMTWDFDAKIHAEAWTKDPHPEQKRTLFRRAPADGRPALIMCFRAQVPSPPGKSKKWSTAGREFTVPKTVVVSGQERAPQFLTVKVVSYAATMGAGKSYFSNFRLTRVADQKPDQQPVVKP